MVCGKLALVTGAASGIGRATCRILAQEGAKVIAGDRNSEDVAHLIKELNSTITPGGQHSGLSLDVSDAESVRDGLLRILEHHDQPPTIVVNSAGIVRDNFMLNLSESDFDEVINVNLKGTFLVMQTMADSIVKHGIKAASIVNVGSIIGRYGNMGQINYAASKAGVELLTKTAAKELGKQGIRCNTVLPGVIDTPLIKAIPDKVKNNFLATIAMGRFGKPEEVAEVITFLASEKSSYVNGASIEVTGGF